MAYGSSYASEGRELPRLLLILVRGAAHELAHGLNTLIFLLDLDLRGDAYGARRGERRRMRGGDVATRLDVEHVCRHANDATAEEANRRIVRDAGAAPPSRTARRCGWNTRGRRATR